MKHKKSNSHFDFNLIGILLKSKRSQAWGMDLMIALVIFSLGIIAFYVYSLNTPSEGKEIIEKLFYDGKIVANTILSEGYPREWNTDNVQKIGILINNKIDATKLQGFYNLTRTSSDYNRTKLLFNTKYDYYFFLDENMIINSTTVEGIGKPGVDKSIIEGGDFAKNLVKITRFTVYEDKPMTAYVYIWEE